MGNAEIYIQLFSIHGLLRGENIELGRNADTGGQVKYVIELLNTLSRAKEIRKVDLFTRLISDKTVSPAYAQQIERLNDKARIVRIPCGGTKYLRKELLWPHLDEFVDKTLKFVKDEGEIPDVVHGHYADAGYVAMELSTLWGVPLIFTGHSLGRVKKHDLEALGMSSEEMNKRFKLDHRIRTEEEIIGVADFTIAGTQQEVAEQYGNYDGNRGAEFRVIPPGVDLDRFFPFYDDPITDTEKKEKLKQAQFFMQKELERFLTNPEKPLILALSRPDYRKNIPTLITAFGEDKELQAIANLAIFAGIRKDISTMDENEREVLTELLLLMDKFDLYGKLAIPKRHNVGYDVPVLYRETAKKNGVFVNPAFKENFGLTLIEAAASGLPIVAADDGGPREIVQSCSNGLLVNVNDPQDISRAVKKILVDQDRWKKYSQNGAIGVRKHYSWEAHRSLYLKQIKSLQRQRPPKFPAVASNEAIGEKFSKVTRLFVTDIDDTFLGDDEAIVELVDLVQKHRHTVAFGVATGRPVDSAVSVLQEHRVPHPDFVISSVGTEIYYGPKLLLDRGWRTHIASQWNREEIRMLLEKLPFLRPQEEEAQREFKLSYILEANGEQLAIVHEVLTKNRLRYNLIYSSNMYLDLLPYRASKGKAIRYLSYKWNIPLKHILTAGDSENDEDMLRGEMCGVVVANYHSSLGKLKGLRHVYFAKRPYAAGIIEGIAHFRFLEGK